MNVHAKQAGVSLIELMVSLLIGSLMIVGAVTVFMQSRNTYRTNDSAARLQEIGRYAMDVIEPDVRLAGYWGLTNKPDFIENRGTASDAVQQAVDTGLTVNCEKNWTVNVARYLDGRDNGAYGLNCAATSQASWADVLIVRRASSTTTALTNNRMQIQSNRIRGAIFKNGTLPGGYGAAPASETHDLFVNAYYVSNPASGPVLMRQTLADGPTVENQTIIPGVEDLQVQFGIDSNADGNADQYVNPGNVPATAQIVSARIWLLIRAEDIEVGFVNNQTFYNYANQTRTFSDNRRRLLVTKTIQIRNATL